MQGYGLNCKSKRFAPSSSGLYLGYMLMNSLRVEPGYADNQKIAHTISSPRVDHGLATRVSTADDTASNAPAPAQGTTPVQSGPESRGQEEEAREAFLQMMSNWYTEYVLANTNAQPPLPLLYLSQFLWLPKCENLMRVFDELSCTPEENLKCDMSLLRDLAYHWWKMLTSVVLKERVTLDFFLEEFRRMSIS
ncbi:Retrotransposon gag domain-containing 1 [Gossypium australe]|uniref:Retrotransposon gag domain-containing 1 n=1 Tax=Gossypium australe TaxID=47621 RepID=A0A5B6WPT6_9ROSI|nr:Retrotransposon gag domain-containing 1 [Gossypium australe]